MASTTSLTLQAENPSLQPERRPAFDYNWFAARFADVLDRLDGVESSLLAIGETVAREPEAPPAEREYYSVAEFAELVDRREFTVREWCRLARIHAEKCDTGRGDAKSWKIPSGELQRYRDHGLLPATYLR